MNLSSDINPLLEQSIGKIGVIFTLDNFVYNCKIQKVSGDWVQFYDLKKKFTKILKISEIKEVQFS